MKQRTPRRPNAGVVALMCIAVVATLVVPAATASNDGPGNLAGVDHDYSDTPANTWGVSDLGPASTNFQYDSLVFAIAQIGNTLYVGGRFQNVTDGNTEISRPYLAAFNATTGNYISSFQPNIDFSVYALAASPDGTRLFVGGEFTNAGAANTTGFAALNPATGAADTSFGLEVTREWSNNDPRIHALDVVGDWLYVGGNFSHLNGANGSRVQTSRLGRVSASTGIVDTGWRPNLSGGTVWAVDATPDGNRVYAGGTFLLAGGQQSQAFAVLDTASGALIPGLDTSFGTTNFPIGSGYIFVATIAAVGDNVWVGGQNHKLVLAEQSNLNVLRRYQTNNFGSADGRGGDYQAIAVAGDVIFAGCHCWGRMRELGTNPQYQVEVDSVQAFDATTGDHLAWYEPAMRGADGAWALHVAADNCLWIGSDIYRSGGQDALGLVRHCPTGGPGGGDTEAPTSISNLSGTWEAPAVALSWDPATDNVGVTSYEISRDGNVIGSSLTSGFTDTSAPTDTTVTYNVRARDAAGNWGPTTSIDVVTDIVNGFACVVADNGDGSVTIAWNDLGANGYDLSHDGEPARWVRATSYRDFSPGDDYTITAWGNGVGGTTTSCTNPGGGGGNGFVCTVTPNGDGTVTVTWPDIGANGYDFSHDGEPARWVTTNSFLDTTPGNTYTITAWGNGVSGTTTTCQQ